MANTVCNSCGVAADQLMRASNHGHLVKPLNGRELRRQGKRDRKREATKAKLFAHGFA